MGRDVAVLVNEELTVGNHFRQGNASNLSGDIYFYRLQCGPFTATKKLELLR
jgi:hypothetical protein